MDTIKLAGSVLDTPLGSPLLSFANWTLWQDALRRPLLHRVERALHGWTERPEAAFAGSRRIGQERTWLALAALATVDRLVQRRSLSPHFTRVALDLWARAALQPAPASPAGRRFRAQFGCDPPWFITISPGHACNLRCAGCYADSGDGSARLPWATFDRIICEARELWGAPLVVLSGGEPLAYRSDGHGVLDVIEAHPDMLFLVFTNGTLIDRDVARRLARAGNPTVAISVEGLRARTDERRGAGCFDQALQAMAYLREAGMLFGISATATRHNCEELVSQEFLDLFFREQGAFYAFLFHYMPIGRCPDMGLMPTPQQRLDFWRRTSEVVEQERLLLFDFWNSGPQWQGCLSAGREGGYIYIDWNGKVMPCVFAPYSVANIQQVYEQGGTLNDVWQAPFLRAIREWQRQYGYGQPKLQPEGDWLRPCPMRDHYGMLRELVQRYGPEPEDEAARQALADAGYGRALEAYGETLRQCAGPVWQEVYLGQEQGKTKLGG